MSASFNTLLYHVVVATRDGRPFLTHDLRDGLYRALGVVVRGHGGQLVAAAAVPDHLHLLVRLRTEHSISEAVALVKSSSAAWLRRQLPTSPRFAWQPGFSAFTVGARELAEIARTFDDQERQHRSHTLIHELLILARPRGFASLAGA
jgi:REP element-mobilizing transposase RayT